MSTNLIGQIVDDELVGVKTEDKLFPTKFDNFFQTTKFQPRRAAPSNKVAGVDSRVELSVQQNIVKNAVSTDAGQDCVDAVNAADAEPAVKFKEALDGRIETRVAVISRNPG